MIKPNASTTATLYRTNQERTNINNAKIMPPSGAEGPNSPFLVPAGERAKTQAIHTPLSQPVVTVDDLEVLAQQLLVKIRILQTYKYPLAVRRGVKHPR